MANKITRTIKTTTILYVIYGENESEPQAVTLSGILSDDDMWKVVKKAAGGKGCGLGLPLQ